MPPKKKTGEKSEKLSPIEKAREAFVEKFEKNYGEGVLDRSGDEKNSYEVISTGCLSLDYALGVGGYVEGRITEIWGGDAIGKTTLVLQGLREAQRKYPDKLVAFIDMEGTFDRAWAFLHGVNVAKDSLYLIIPSSAEEVADQVKDCIRSGLFSMVVVDSIGAMIPEVEKEKDADEAVVATQAKIITRMVKIAAVEARKTSTVVILLNQVRANISAYGKATQTSGGFALKHCSTHKIELKLGGEKVKVQMDGEARVVGHPIAAMIERNKVAPPFQRASFTLFHTPSDKYGDAGVDRVADAVSIGIRTGAIAQAGAWYTLPNGDRFNGKPKIEDAMRANPDLIDEVRDAALSMASEAISENVDLDREIDAVDPETGEFGESVRSRFGSLTKAMTAE